MIEIGESVGLSTLGVEEIKTERPNVSLSQQAGFDWNIGQRLEDRHGSSGPKCGGRIPDQLFVLL
ncbi:MAG TPA: hypothetical protein VEX40_10980, partial [Mycobacterium sp.]|nr:hypothetical protein [Mycobacterium sp.]